jgi:hypothetical protein
LLEAAAAQSRSTWIAHAIYTDSRTQTLALAPAAPPSVNFDLLMPVLAELSIALGDTFVAVPANELERTEQATRRAPSATRALANGASAGQLAAMLDRADRDRRHHNQAS